ncbi:hypothetical protein T552_02866 [Pneumocystis carinii B80]|uniref:Uncharacterized protein n=1 Tax=Pneumocystis carinii (strain B80) TaxID=1408658 RepID=A0A0W4ZDB0_PNEC8|nr:hypothetical protein T552_02866 [Pneumocystis carinii B80]KTW26384.1 hypothetical protein T552_02866 [Pneumocystis carinii B80]
MSLILDSELFALRTHPYQPVLTVGTLNGRVSSYYYNLDEQTYHQAWYTYRHRIACRDLRYSMSGEEDTIDILSVGADGMIKCAKSETGKVIWRAKRAHMNAINVVYYLSEMNFVSGDDNGKVKLWDKRVKESVKEIDVHKDYISSFLGLNEKVLLSTSGDAFFSVVDFRIDKCLPIYSYEFGEDLLSSCLVKSETIKPKICIGTVSGMIKIFNKGEWDNDTSQILLSGKKNMLSIDVMMAWNDDIIIVSGNDGVIRVLNIHPNIPLGILGYQDSSVDVLAKTYDDKWILSGGDKKITAWKANWSNNLKKHDRSNQELSDQVHKKKLMLDKDMSFFEGLT